MGNSHIFSKNVPTKSETRETSVPHTTTTIVIPPIHADSREDAQDPDAYVSKVSSDEPETKNRNVFFDNKKTETVICLCYGTVTRITSVYFINAPYAHNYGFDETIGHSIAYLIDRGFKLSCSLLFPETNRTAVSLSHEAFPVEMVRRLCEHLSDIQRHAVITCYCPDLPAAVRVDNIAADVPNDLVV